MDTFLVALRVLRIIMYFFTSLSFLLAAVAVFKPMAESRHSKKHKAEMLIILAFVFFCFGVASIARSFNRNDLSLFIFDFPVTIMMIFLSIWSWRYIFITSKPKLIKQKKENSNEYRDFRDFSSVNH